MGNTTTLLFGFIFGCIGMGYFMYGKRQQRGMALLAGIALGLFPYFVTSKLGIVLVGLGLMALPFIFSV